MSRRGIGLPKSTAFGFVIVDFSRMMSPLLFVGGGTSYINAYNSDDTNRTVEFHIVMTISFISLIPCVAPLTKS